jgi:hypothetical protein
MIAPFEVSSWHSEGSGEVHTDDGRGVGPERVELTDTEGGTLTHSKAMMCQHCTLKLGLSTYAPGWPSERGSRPVDWTTPSMTGMSCWMKLVSTKYQSMTTGAVSTQTYTALDNHSTQSVRTTRRKR